MSSKPIFDTLAKLPMKKLDKMEYDHGLYLERFTAAKASKVKELERIRDRHSQLKKQALRDKESSIPLALAKAMEMRHTKADELITRSVLSVIRSNQFYHKLMMVLIQDTKAGVDYDPERVKSLIPKEFTDMVSESIISTNLEGLLSDLAKEVET